MLPLKLKSAHTKMLCIKIETSTIPTGHVSSALNSKQLVKAIFAHSYRMSVAGWKLDPWAFINYNQTFGSHVGIPDEATAVVKCLCTHAVNIILYVQGYGLVLFLILYIGVVSLGEECELNTTH